MKDLRRILVGFDELPASRDALALGKMLSETAEAELIEPSVRPSWPAAIDPDGLKEIAAAEHADLIVLGSADRGRLGRVLPDSFGERVLNDAPCAVAIAPLGLADTEFRLRRIAIAYDGSKEAGVALALAIALAQCAGASLLILGAVEIEINVTGFGPDTLEEVEVARMRRHLDRARARVPDSVAVETRLLHGTPGHLLAEAAEGSDLLLLGSRGHYGPARRLFLGSLATQVTRHAPCATLIGPEPSADPQQPAATRPERLRFLRIRPWCLLRMAPRPRRTTMAPRDARPLPIWPRRSRQPLPSARGL